MRIDRAVTLLIPALALSVGGPALAGHAAPLQKGCAPAGYSHNKVSCMVVPAHGSFTVKVPGTSERLRGTGSKSTAGTQLSVTKVPPPVPSKGGIGFRLRATGSFNPLHVSPGKPYRYVAGKNRLVAVSTVTSSGVYQVIR